MPKVIVISILFLFSAIWPLHAADQPLKVAILVSTDKQIAAYNSLISQFENSTGVDVQLDFYSDISFKKHIKNWVELGTYDVLYWQAGKRLEQLIKKKDIVPLSDLLDLTNLKQQYRKNALAAVTYDERIYALPIGHYIWGFYYSKPIFDQLSLSPPTTWEEFQKVAFTLKKNGVTPLVQATGDHWPVLAWLDYIALNVGGVAYRQQLINGDFGASPSLDDKLLDAFSYLASNNLFFAANHDWRWDQTIPTIARKRAGMTLTGQFVESSIKSIADKEIGFFPFPIFDTNDDTFEIAPMEVLVVPTSSNNQTHVASLLEFIIGYMAIDGFSSQLDWLSVSKQFVANSEQSQRIDTAQVKVDKATVLKQYFDRDATPEISLAWANAIITSFATGNADALKQIDFADPILFELQKVDEKNNEKLFSLSTLTGKGTYLFSNIIHHVYKKLGRKTVINRFDSSEAAINSLKYAADGELIRIEDISELNQLAIKIPEPITQSRLFLVGQKGTCELVDEKLPSGKRLEYGIDAKVFEKWAKRLAPKIAKKTASEQMWITLESQQTDYIISFESELYAQRNKLSSLCFLRLQSIDNFHYIANRHSTLKSPLTTAIVQFKQTDKYQELLLSFGLGILPDKG